MSKESKAEAEKVLGRLMRRGRVKGVGNWEGEVIGVC